jgi:hypothetical protein
LHQNVEFAILKIVLNQLLLKKKELANGALFPSEQVEVRQSEIINELGF